MWMLQRGHSGDGCVLASTLCKYVLSWPRVRRVMWGSISSELIMCDRGARNFVITSCG